MNFDPAEQTIFSLAEGDVLMTEGSGSVETVGTSAVWRGELRGTVCFQNTLLRIRPRRGTTEGRFLAWWARHAHASGQIAAVSSGANIQHIGSDGLKSLPVNVPSLEEQRRIADFLDDRIARIDQIIAARREQARVSLLLSRRAVMDRLLDGRFNQLPIAPWFDTVPGAHAVRLSNRWSVIDCKHRTPEYRDVGYPVVSPGDISPGRLNLQRATRFVSHDDYLDLADDLRRCRRGDLVYSRNASAGTAAYVDTDDPFTMGQDVCRITSVHHSQLYLSYCLNYLTEPQLDSVRVGSTFTRINVELIKALMIPYRDPQGQQLVAAECDDLVEAGARHVALLSCSIALLREYKPSLITAAVTGELDVTTAGSGIPG